MNLSKPLGHGMQGWISTYKGTADSNLYFKINGDQILIVEVFVDDIIFGGNEGMCMKFVGEM